MRAILVLSVEGVARAVCRNHAREYQALAPRCVGAPERDEQCEFCEQEEKARR